jgi:putative nucleotidyltransferase with HDIG domain
VTDRASLPELLGALSVACDQADGQRDETALRAALVAARLAEAAGLSVRDAADSYWTAMLRSLGCTGFGHESSQSFTPDDRALRAAMLDKDTVDKRDMLRRVTGTARPFGVGQVARAIAAIPAAAKGGQAISQCDAGVALARGLDLPAGVVAALDDIEERWDGKGQPNGDTGEAIAIAARVATVAWIAVLAVERGADDGGVAEVQRRAGKHLDPSLAAVFCRHAPSLVPAPGSVWDDAVTAEPGGVTFVDTSGVDRVATAMGRFADLLSVFTIDHSARVADFTAQAAEAVGLDEVLARRAGLVHDVGRVCVPAGTWEKAGPFTATEREQVRLHASVTERVLARSPMLAPLARIAGAAHERADASGYPKGLADDQTDPIGRLLAAADVWEALQSRRPHRPAFTRDAAITAMRQEVDRGRLARDAVDAVLAVDGVTPPPTPMPRTWPNGLTDREVEVLRLVAVGEPNKRVAAALGISPKTAARHVENLYAKIGCRGRVGATLFAVEHGLVRG